MEADPAFKRFLGNLTNMGYFQGELPGSKKYTDLLRTAESHWQDMRLSVEHSHHGVSQLMKDLQ